MEQGLAFWHHRSHHGEDHRKHQHVKHHTDKQESGGVGIRQAKFGTDKACAPQ